MTLLSMATIDMAGLMTKTTPALMTAPRTSTFPDEYDLVNDDIDDFFYGIDAECDSLVDTMTKTFGGAPR